MRRKRKVSDRDHGRANMERLPCLKSCGQVPYDPQPKSQRIRGNDYRTGDERFHTEYEAERHIQPCFRAHREAARLSAQLISRICNLHVPTKLQGYSIWPCLYFRLLCCQPLLLSRVYSRVSTTNCVPKERRYSTLRSLVRYTQSIDTRPYVETPTMKFAITLCALSTRWR